MNRINKITTRSGDRGMSDLPGYEDKISKGDIIFECIGAIDETNAYIGLAREMLKQYLVDFADLLDTIQNDLFNLGVDVIKMNENIASKIDQTHIKSLEDASAKINTELPPLDSFILPQGPSAPLHVARVNTRRAERKYWALCEARETSANHEHRAGIYLNRLSDLLFILGRYVNKLSSDQEKTWEI